MDVMNNINRPATYKEEVAQYTKKDAIHALLFFAYGVVFLTANSFFHHSDAGSEILSTISEMGIIPYTLFRMRTAFFMLVPLFIIVRKKGQGLRSLGLHLIEWKKALLAGLFLVAVVPIFTYLPFFSAESQIHPIEVVITSIVVLLVGALWEDVVFVGYIQTRIYGLIKNDFWAVIAAGLIFAIMHYPFTIGNFLSGDGVRFGLGFWNTFALLNLQWVAMHAVFNFVFREYRSIITVTLFHFSANLAGQPWRLWEYPSETGFYSLSAFLAEGIGIGIVAVILITSVFPYIKKRLTEK